MPRKDRCVSKALVQTIPVLTDVCCSLLPCVGAGPCLHRKLYVALHCGQEPCKTLPMTDKQCLVWIKRKNKALRIIEADGENTGVQNESKRRLLL